jgi:hypothetical protein
MRFFQPNLDRKGRVTRAIWGVLCLGGAAWAAYAGHRWAALGLVLGGLFGFFEAARGWCVVRACGIKTRL